jgi:hypothetical protein
MNAHFRKGILAGRTAGPGKANVPAESLGVVVGNDSPSSQLSFEEGFWRWTAKKEATFAKILRDSSNIAW